MQNEATFLCKSCGHHENADLNAAKNILAAGLAVNACGGKSLDFPSKILGCSSKILGFS